jgi:protein-S-isoprenylcysteine O-methyltransferase Ste14
MTRFIAFVYGIICYSIFFATFLYLIGFVGNLFVPVSIDSGASSATGVALLINIGLIALFGLQHSIMARRGFKAWWTKLVPKSVERSTYVLLTSLILILLYWQWRPMGQVIWQVDAVWLQTALWGIFFAGFGLVLLSTFIIDHFDLFGLRQVTLNLLQKEYTDPQFMVTFFYKIIRHPLYFGFFLVFWGTPTMTLGHLVFAIGMSAYILIGVRYEERDLVQLLGEDYAKYRELVPMFIPRPGKVHDTVKSGSAGVARSSMR